jgi:hypothetical protein
LFWGSVEEQRETRRVCRERASVPFRAEENATLAIPFGMPRRHIPYRLRLGEMHLPYDYAEGVFNTFGVKIRP